MSQTEEAKIPFKLFKVEPWMDQAACKGMPVELFYQERGQTGYHVDIPVREACSRCPVQQECLESGMNEEFGIWGGTTQKDRRVLRRERPVQTPSPYKHGTKNGLLRHLDAGEVPCPWCIAATLGHYNSYTDYEERKPQWEIAEAS